jgi:hypothetical protein
LTNRAARHIIKCEGDRKNGMIRMAHEIASLEEKPVKRAFTKEEFRNQQKRQLYQSLRNRKNGK